MYVLFLFTWQALLSIVFSWAAAPDLGNVNIYNEEPVFILVSDVSPTGSLPNFTFYGHISYGYVRWP